MTGAAPAAIQAHYDAGDAFFATFLDPSLIYSCALFDDRAASLEDAQRAKIDWHLDAAGVAARTRLLDIGCGWGALMERAVETRRAASAVGLTLSRTQAAHIAAGASAGIEAQLEHWRNHKPSRPYDAILSIGAFEHFAEPGLAPHQRIAAYRTFFASCAGWLPGGAMLSLQTMAYPTGFDRAAYDGSPWGDFVRSHIFPESDLPELAEILAAAEPTFEAVVIRNDRQHYAQTLRCWLARLRARRAEAAALVGERRVGAFERYFRVSIGAFELGNLLLLRLVFRRRRR